MAADGDTEVVVCDSNSENSLDSPPLVKNDFTFVCDGLDSFLDSLKLDSKSPKGDAQSESGACAVGADPEKPGLLDVSRSDSRLPTNSRTSVSSTSNSKVLLKDYDCPKPIILFNQSIPILSTHKFTRTIQFTQQRSSSDTPLIDCRFPSELSSLYKVREFQRATLNFNEPSRVIKSRRRRQRNRLSLTYHDFDNDDAHNRRPLLPTKEDLMTTYDKIYGFRNIPYIYGCTGGKSCENPSKCAQLSSFSLFMEVNPKPGFPLHPLARENINCVLGAESNTIDELSAMIAVSAVKQQNAPVNRLFIPVSCHLPDKIRCLKGVIPEIFPKYAIENSVREVVDDLLNFVDRQSCFEGILAYDPDLTPSDTTSKELESQKDTDNSSITELPSEEKPPSGQKRKRGKCKEPNKVLRELKKLMNISVTDETLDVTENTSASKCTEQSCVLGCVCSSVHEKLQSPPEHCGNIGCMFNCVCLNEPQDAYINVGELSKDEKSWHQTVIRKRNNDLEIKSGVERAKRRKKMPSRYENTVTEFTMNPVELNPQRTKKSYPKERTSNLSTASHSKSLENLETKQVSPPKPTPPQEDITKLNAGIVAKIRKSLRDSYQNKLTEHIERRLNLCVNDRAYRLIDTFIWCTLHYKYDCYCINWIIFGKENNLVCKPSSFNRFVVDKFLEGIHLEKDSEKNLSNPLKAVWYDGDKECARTAGVLYGYHLRNKDPLYVRKLSRLLQNKIVSNSNSFIKARPTGYVVANQPTDNFPFVPASNRKITRGVGNVIKISPEIDEHEVDVGCDFTFPNNLQFPDKETEDFNGLLVDDDSEFIPKPKNIFLLEKQQLSFSSILKKTPEKINEKTNSDDQVESDSDVELVEDPIETYSLLSTPEPDVIDGGVLSDSSSDGEEVPLIVNVSDGEGDSPIVDVSDGEGDSPIVNVSDGEGDSPIVNVSEDSCSKLTNCNSKAIECSSSVIPEDSDPLPTSLNGKTTEDDDSVEYPQKGFFCMSHPELGFLCVKEARPNSFIMEDPMDSNCVKVFKNCKEASDYMKGLVNFRKDPAVPWVMEPWVMVTRGILEKYQCKPLHKIKWAQNKMTTSKSGGKVDTVEKKNTVEDIFESSHELLKSKNTEAQQVATPSNVLATFSNIGEANSFLEKNYQSRLVVRPCVTGTIGKKIVRFPLLSGPRVRGGIIPVRAGVRTVLVSGPVAGQSAGSRPMIHLRPSLRVSGAVASSLASFSSANVGVCQPSVVTSSVRNNMPPLTSFSIKACPKKTIIVTAKGKSGENTTAVASCSYAIVAKSSADSTDSTVRSPQVKSPLEVVVSPAATAKTPIQESNPAKTSPEITIVSTENTPGNAAGHHKGKFIIESITRGRPVLPKPVIPKVPLRRADVIVPRNDEFATLISPAPSDSQPPPRPPAPEVFNGVVLPKPDKKEVRAYICNKKPSSKYRSLLQKPS